MSHDVPECEPRWIREMKFQYTVLNTKIVALKHQRACEITKTITDTKKQSRAKQRKAKSA
jgi:hypothetical protein